MYKIQGIVRIFIIHIALITLTSEALSESLVFPPYRHSHGIRKARQIHLSMFLSGTRFNDPQGIATAKMITRDDPDTENDDDEVVVYGVNSGNHEIIYNTSMWGLASYGSKGSGKGEFSKPRGIECDKKGNVYIADRGNSRIVHLFNPRKKVRWKGSFNGEEAGIKRLSSPEQVALDSKGYLYVTDPGTQRLIRFSGDGSSASVIGENSMFRQGPCMLEVADGRARWREFDKDRYIYCSSMNGKIIHKLDFKGNEIRTAALPSGDKAGYAALDHYHNLWITSEKTHKILKYDRDLNFLDSFGSKGRGDNEFIEPRGIDIWERYGQTFIAERKGAQYYWIGTDVKKRNINKTEKGTYFIELFLTEHSYVSLFTETGNNRDTLFLLKKRMISPGEAKIGLPADKVERIKKGSLTLRIEPTYSSYTFNHWDYEMDIKELK